MDAIVKLDMKCQGCPYVNYIKRQAFKEFLNELDKLYHIYQADSFFTSKAITTETIRNGLRKEIVSNIIDVLETYMELSYPQKKNEDIHINKALKEQT